MLMLVTQSHERDKFYNKLKLNKKKSLRMKKQKLFA